MNKTNKIIYLDNASATILDKEVLKKMHSSYLKFYANPSAIHEGGLEVKKVIEESRTKIASSLKAHTNEIIFTSGATESNNLAIIGLLNKLNSKYKKPHIITSQIEHASVLEVVKDLEKQNKIEVTYLEVDENGFISLVELKKSLKENTVLVSVMYANNEIGVIEPIKEIAKTIRHFRKNKTKENHLPYLHTDMTQGVNYLEIEVEKLGIDMASFNAAKIYGPKGIGALYKKRSVHIESLIKGGDQEFGIRSGTLNAANIIGFASALEITLSFQNSEIKRLTKLRESFIKNLKKVFAKHDVDLKINGHDKDTLPNIVNVTFDRIPSDLFLVELSMKGVYVSEKSACKSEEKKNSHVIEALYGKDKGSLNSIRFSFGRDTKKEDLDFTIKTIDNILKKLKVWYK